MAYADNFYLYDVNATPISNTNNQNSTTVTDQGLEITDNTSLYCDSQGVLVQSGSVTLTNTNSDDYIDITKIEFLDTSGVYVGEDYGIYTIKDDDNKINISGSLGNCVTTNSYYMAPSEEITLNISYTTVFDKLSELIHITTVNNKFAVLQVTHKKSEAYAVVRDSDTSNSNDQNDLLEFRYDGQRDDYTLTFDCANTGTSNPGWSSYIGGTSDPSNNTVTQVNFTDNFSNVKPTSCYRWFAGYNTITTGCQPLITNFNNLINFDTSNATAMNSMFYGCSSLTTLDVSNFNTAKVTNMSSIFQSCSSLTNLDLSNFNTSNVTNMSSMFCACKTLTSLDVTNFNTAKVTNMSSMFRGCSNLTDLDTIDFNTSNVINMSSMFSGCNSLINLDVTNFNTAKVTNMSSMFYACNTLTSLDVTNFNTAKVTNMCSMFRGCSNLIKLDVTMFDTSSVTEMSSMFQSCNVLTDLDVSNFNTVKVTNMSSMFYACKTLTSLDVTNFNTSNVTNMSGMFNYCESLTNLDLSSFNTSNVTNMSSIFCGCTCLTNLNISNFNTAKVTNMNSMFHSCNVLTSLDLSNFNTSNVTNMSSMFQNCYGITELDLSNFNTSNVTNMKGMFFICSKLITLNISNFSFTKNTVIGSNSTDPNTQSAGMFAVCKSLKTIYYNKDISNIIQSGNDYYAFWNCPNLPHYSTVTDEYRNRTYAYPDNGVTGYFTLKTPVYTLTKGDTGVTDFKDESGNSITKISGNYGDKVKVMPVFASSYEIDSITDNAGNTYSLDENGYFEVELKYKGSIVVTSKTSTLDLQAAFSGIEQSGNSLNNNHDSNSSNVTSNCLDSNILQENINLNSESNSGNNNINNNSNIADTTSNTDEKVTKTVEMTIDKNDTESILFNNTLDLNTDSVLVPIITIGCLFKKKKYKC